MTSFRSEDFDTSGVSGPQQKILDVLATFEPHLLNAVHRSIVAAYAGVSPRGSGYRANLSRLRTLGLIEYPGDSKIALTENGRNLATADTINSIEELHESWCRIVSGPQAAILRHLIGVYPDGVDRDDLAETVGVSPLASGYRANLSRLRSLGVLDYPDNGRVKATDLLWPKGLA